MRIVSFLLLMFMASILLLPACLVPESTAPKRGAVACSGADKSYVCSSAGISGRPALCAKTCFAAAENFANGELNGSCASLTGSLDGGLCECNTDKGAFIACN